MGGYVRGGGGLAIKPLVLSGGTKPNKFLVVSGFLPLVVGRGVVAFNLGCRRDLHVFWLKCSWKKQPRMTFQVCERMKVNKDWSHTSPFNHSPRKKKHTYLGPTPHPVTVTTRTTPFLVGELYKTRLFPTASERGCWSNIYHDIMATSPPPTTHPPRFLLSFQGAVGR